MKISLNICGTRIAALYANRATSKSVGAATVVSAFLCLALCLLGTPAYAQQAQISAIHPSNTDSTIEILGQSFGDTCKSGEVHADYGKFIYSLPIKVWSDKLITARLPDLGAATQIAIKVKTQNGHSNGKKQQL